MALPAPAQSHVSLLFTWGESLRAVALREGQSVVVGRSEPAGLVIDDPSLSRVHARLSLDGGRVTVEDLTSTNGSFLNDARIGTASMRIHDIVRLGTVELRLGAHATARHEISAVSHASFMRSVSVELARARATGRCASVLALRQKGLDQAASALQAALRPFDRWCTFAPDLVLVLLPELDGANARRWLNAARWRGKEDLRAGVASYPALTATADELISRALEACRATQIGYVEEAVSTPARAHDGPILLSPLMQRLYALVARAARTTLPVLVQGETGSGKELVARAIHDQSPRHTAVFKAINCATLPGPLLESVLFGHERGAFTGAERQTPGIFEQAQGGTVFLDEVAELSPPAQAALLRVLEHRQVVRVGGAKEIAVDTRVVAATHRNLSAMVSAGAFREDLMFRLDALTLRVPPLRERKEEILPLARLFLARARQQWSSNAGELSPEVCAALSAYGWPGNVRQLKNMIERAAVVCAGPVVELDDLPDELWQQSGELTQPEAHREASTMRAAKAATSDGLRSLPARVREFEIELITDALVKAGGNQAQAARLLGIPRRTLASKAQVLGLLVKEQPSDFAEE